MHDHRRDEECRTKSARGLGNADDALVKGKEEVSNTFDIENPCCRYRPRRANREPQADVTIGEIMTVAGLTHGGFYRHFGSKEELYAETVRHFLRKEAPERWQKGPAGACKPDQSFARFVIGAYLSRDHLEDVDGSYPLVGLSSDVAHSGHAVKGAYREVAESMIQVYSRPT
jgi:AcrR family transcriptional regulator